jgi:hypothetical protein
LNGKRGRTVRATLVKTIFKYVFKGKIMKKHIPYIGVSCSNAENKFHIISWSLMIGWSSS